MRLVLNQFVAYLFLTAALQNLWHVGRTGQFRLLGENDRTCRDLVGVEIDRELHRLAKCVLRSPAWRLSRSVLLRICRKSMPNRIGQALRNGSLGLRVQH